MNVKTAFLLVMICPFIMQGCAKEELAGEVFYKAGEAVETVPVAAQGIYAIPKADFDISLAPKIHKLRDDLAVKVETEWAETQKKLKEEKEAKAAEIAKLKEDIKSRRAENTEWTAKKAALRVSLPAMEDHESFEEYGERLTAEAAAIDADLDKIVQEQSMFDRSDWKYFTTVVLEPGKLLKADSNDREVYGKKYVKEVEVVKARKSAKAEELKKALQTKKQAAAFDISMVISTNRVKDDEADIRKLENEADVSGPKNKLQPETVQMAKMKSEPQMLADAMSLLDANASCLKAKCGPDGKFKLILPSRSPFSKRPPYVIFAGANIATSDDPCVLTWLCNPKPAEKSVVLGNENLTHDFDVASR